MNWSLAPDWLKALIIGGGCLAMGVAIGRTTGPTKTVTVEKIVEKTIVDEKEIEKRVAEMKATLEKEWNRQTHTVTTIKPDGSKVIDNTTSNTGKQTQVVEKVVTVEKIVDRVVTVEKLVDKTVTVVSRADWAVSASIEPLPALKQDWHLGLGLERRILGEFWVTTGLQSDLAWTPKWTVGVRMGF